MATITKKELVDTVTGQLQARGIGITHDVVALVAQSLIEGITDSLANGDTVVMRRFGAFHVRETKARVGRNPKDPGKEVPIPASAGVKFKPGKELKERIAASLHVLRERSA